MKALKYILILVAVATSCSVFAQFAESPMYNFQSTSAMADSGSSLPSAASTGFSTADSYYEDNFGGSSSSTPAYAPRRSRPDSHDEPFEDPIGDALALLLILAAGYGLVLRRKASAE